MGYGTESEAMTPTAQVAESPMAACDPGGQKATFGTMLLTIEDVAAVLRCSPRSVYRLIGSGRVPPPCRFGSLMRWTPATIETWVAEGCPPLRRAPRG